MKLYGRITIYGEYLMHDNVQGLIMPSNLFLETTDDKNCSSIYDEQIDSVLPLIKKRGIIPPHTLKGNLPLGYGLAGSTILSFLYLSHIEDSHWKKEIINDIDREIHGFKPSGLDYESCIHQQWGLFCNDFGWEPLAPPNPINYTLITFPKESKISLNSIQKRVLSKKPHLTEIQQNLNESLKTYNIIDLELLTEYSKILLSLDLYSIDTSEFVSTLMKNGFIAKGIGGLHNKAVIVIHGNYSKGNYSYLEKLAFPLGGKIIS